MFLSVPLLSEYIRYNRKLNITFNFRFICMKKIEKCDVTCSWTPPPVTNCHTFSDPSPSSVTYFVDCFLSLSPSLSPHLSVSVSRFRIFVIGNHKVSVTL